MTRLRLMASVGCAVAALYAAGVPETVQAKDFSIGGLTFSFDTGDVAYAYRDGYWDNDHRWHAWQSDHERDQFRTHYKDRYDDRRHDRVENDGWRDARGGEIRSGGGERRYDDDRRDTRSYDRDDYRRDEDRRDRLEDRRYDDRERGSYERDRDYDRDNDRR